MAKYNLQINGKRLEAEVDSDTPILWVLRGVIQMAADKSGWGTRKGLSQGFSVYFSHRSYVAQVADVETKQGRPVVQKIHVAVDCGIVINKSGAQQQVRGGVVDGMGHAMFSNLTFKDGAAEQRNFNSFRLIRLKEVPDVDVHFIDNGIDPTGLGEPALPPEQRMITTHTA